MRARVYASPADRSAAYRRRKRDAKLATFDPGQRGALLWLNTKRGGAWLELLPGDRAWLTTALQNCGREV